MKSSEKIIVVSPDVEKKVRDFSVLLDAIESMEHKAKFLWKDIYFNAISDRNLALKAINSLWTLIEEKPEDHMIYGDKLSKYMERLSRANDQLIELAKLVEKARQEDKGINVDAAFKEFDS